MKGSPAVPGGLLTSKPTWLCSKRCSAASAFFVVPWSGQPQGPKGEFVVELPAIAGSSRGEVTRPEVEG